MKKIILSIIFIACFIFFFPMNAQAVVTAQTVTLNPTEDSWIDEGQPDQNFGSQNQLVIGLSTQPRGGIYHQRALIKFDLSQIPAGSNIDSAGLSYELSGYSGHQITTTAYRVARVNWSENSVKWNNRPDWIDPPDEGYDVASGVIIVTSIVKLWLSNPQTYPNFGFYILGPKDEGGYIEGGRVYIYSRETSHKPRLTIAYTTPIRSPSPTPTPNLVSLSAMAGTLLPLLSQQANGPTISNVSYSLTPTSANILWHTNVSSNSRVYFGLRGHFDQSSSLQNEYVSDHRVTIDNLLPDTQYNFKAVSTDRNGVTGYSQGMQFTTPSNQSVAANTTAKPSASPTTTAASQLDQPLENVPLIGGTIRSVGNAIEDKLGQVTIETETASQSASQAGQLKPVNKNPLVLIGSYIGINRLVGIILIGLGFLGLISTLLLVILTKKTYHHVRKHLW